MLSSTNLNFKIRLHGSITQSLPRKGQDDSQASGYHWEAGWYQTRSISRVIESFELKENANDTDNHFERNANDHKGQECAVDRIVGHGKERHETKRMGAWYSKIPETRGQTTKNSIPTFENVTASFWQASAKKQKDVTELILVPPLHNRNEERMQWNRDKFKGNTYCKAEKTLAKVHRGWTTGWSI